jgi:DNA-binding CsgD family transcriptional regulator
VAENEKQLEREDAIRRGRECYARREWADAYEAFAAADALEPLDADDLEQLAWAAGLTGRDESLVRALERLYHAHVGPGRTVQAAKCAFWTGFRLLGLGEMSQGSGWLARAQRLVEREQQPCVVEGYLLLPAVRRLFAAADYEAAHASAEHAAAIGERFGDADLVSLARDLQGWVRLRQGQVDQGLLLLDEAMVAVTRGELSPIVAGLVYCHAIASCHQVYALDRAREWTAALARWCESQPQLLTFTGACMVHRAEILQLGGAWLEAIDEARRACAVCDPAGPRATAGDGYYQTAEIHRVRGEFAPAEEAYRQASQLGREPQPGLALLRLSQGQGDAAAVSIRRVVGAAVDPFERTRLLPALVEIALGTGNVEEARWACADLESLAASFATAVMAAMATQARGAVQLAEGDAKASLISLRRAFQVWQEARAPYHAARVRVLLARACRALGDEDGAKLELDCARDVFEKLEAAPDVAMVQDLVKPRAAPPGHRLTARELQVLKLVAAGKTNKAIANELSLSEKTVDRHVSNIFAKVNVPTRAAATAYAYEHKLV